MQNMRNTVDLRENSNAEEARQQPESSVSAIRR